LGRIWPMIWFWVKPYSYFLQHYKEEHKQTDGIGGLSTTLIFNWENEIKNLPRFELSYHHGGDAAGISASVNIMWSSLLRTLRSDINCWSKSSIMWYWDESQASKSCEQGTKAAVYYMPTSVVHERYPCKQYLWIFFAQMNFSIRECWQHLNSSGRNFAIPIDKFGESERKAIWENYCILLFYAEQGTSGKDCRKTKPSVLWNGRRTTQNIRCYRNDYRDKIMGTIETQAYRNRSHHFAGPHELRQICDSPAILMKLKDSQPFIKLMNWPGKLPKTSATIRPCLFPVLVCCPDKEN